MFKYFLWLPNGSCIFASKIKRNKLQRSSKHREKMRSRPVFKASKFREIAALAKRTTGNCVGLIDSVARYRKKLWKAIEGHRQFLRLKQHSPLFLSYISSVLQKPPSPPIFYTFDIVSSHPDYCSQ
jgi:hypothetical protein